MTSLLYYVCVRCCLSYCVPSLCSRSLAAISLSLSSLWICAGGQWSGPPRTNQARSTSSRCWTHWTCSQLSALVFSVIFGSNMSEQAELFWLFILSSSSWRPVREQSSWYSLRSTVSSVTGTAPLQRPSTHMWVEDTEALPFNLDTFPTIQCKSSQSWNPSLHLFKQTAVKG